MYVVTSLELFVSVLSLDWSTHVDGVIRNILKILLKMLLNTKKTNVPSETDRKTFLQRKCKSINEDSIQGHLCSSIKTEGHSKNSDTVNRSKLDEGSKNLNNKQTNCSDDVDNKQRGSIGGCLCAILLHLYDSHKHPCSSLKRLSVDVLCCLLACSPSAQYFAVTNGLLESLIDEIKHLLTTLKMNKCLNAKKGHKHDQVCELSIQCTLLLKGELFLGLPSSKRKRPVKHCSFIFLHFLSATVRFQMS